MNMIVIGAIAAVVYSAALLGIGYRYADNKCDAETLRSQIAQLQTQLKATKAAAEADAKALEEAREETEKLEEATRELQGAISAGVCFSEPDVDGLRKLWGTVTVRPAR